MKNNGRANGHERTKNGQLPPPAAGELVTPTPDPVNSGDGTLNAGGDETITPGSPDTTQIMTLENDDPLKQRIVMPGSRRLIPRLIRKVKHLIRVYIRKELTKDEIAEELENKRRKALRETLTAEAKLAADRMSNCLARIGFEHKTRDGKGNIKQVKKVRFDLIKLYPDEIWFRVDTDRLPHGTNTDFLVEQSVVNNLTVSVGHKIQCRWSELGIWFILERASGTMGIPNHVNLLELWERIPQNKDGLTIPLGYTNNRFPVYESLNELGHILVGGASGSGKSNFLNVILCTLIRRNKPGTFELLLVDFKGGIEFTFYKDIPHLKQIPVVAPDGIITEIENMGPLLDWLEGESHRRMALLKAHGVKDLGGYNAHKRTNRLPNILVFIDEYAVIKLSGERGQGADIERKLIKLLQTVRAVGISFIVCTQIPQRDVLTTLVKGNLQTKIAFSCADLQGSMAILNNGHALNLKPKGRCIFRYQNEAEIQTPYIPLALVQETVTGAITGQYGEVRVRHDVSQQEVLEWALNQNNGFLTIAKTYQNFKARGLSWAELNDWLLRMDGQEYLIGQSLYTVDPGNGGNKGRRLVFKDPDKDSQEPKGDEKNVG